MIHFDQIFLTDQEIFLTNFFFTKFFFNQFFSCTSSSFHCLALNLAEHWAWHSSAQLVIFLSFVNITLLDLSFIIPEEQSEKCSIVPTSGGWPTIQSSLTFPTPSIHCLPPCHYQWGLLVLNNILNIFNWDHAWRGKDNHEKQALAQLYRAQTHLKIQLEIAQILSN